MHSIKHRSTGTSPAVASVFQQRLLVAKHRSTGASPAGASTSPHSVVVCEFDKALQAYSDYEYDRGPYDYSSLIPVARSFREFAQMLTLAPQADRGATP